MLFYVFFYLLAALLVFQGAQALGEPREPLRETPGELALPEAGRRWGIFLVGMGSLCVLAGFLNHAGAVSWGSLRIMRGAGWLTEGAYGFWLVFLARKIAYQGDWASSQHRA